jgi:hypothetical protein
MTNNANGGAPQVPPSPPAGPPKRKTFMELVREHVIPYNSIITVTGFFSVIVGFVSAVALTALGVVLITVILQLIALNVVAREQLVEWAKGSTGLVAILASSFWPNENSSIFRAPPFWGLVFVAVAVVFNAVRIAMG